MAAYQYYQDRGVSWLNLGQDRVDQPLDRSARVGRTDPALSGAAGAAAGVWPGQTKAAFALAQNRALSKVSDRALTVLSSLGAVEIPTGARLGSLKSVLSSDRSSWTGQAESRAAETTHLTRVLNLAQSRTARSVALDKTGRDDIGAGAYTLKLTEGQAQPVEFDFTVSYDEPFGDDNRLILNRLAVALEQHGQTIEAQVVEKTRLDEYGFTAPFLALEVRSRHTGPVDPFTLEDVSGNLVEGLELDRIFQSGLDLTYLQGGRSANPYGAAVSEFRKAQPVETLEPVRDWIPNLVSPQINRSATLDPWGRTDLPGGRYTFRVDQGGETRELVLDIDYYGFFPDDNAAVLTRLAQTLENSGAGLETEVRIGRALDQDGQPATGATLYVSSPGRGAEFTLRDVDRDLIQLLDLQRIHSPAQAEDRAEPGQPSQNPSDRFSLDQTRLAAQALQAFMDGPRKLTVTPAREAVLLQVRGVVQAHNSLMHSLQEAQPYLDGALKGGLARELRLHRETYAGIGVEVYSSGYLGLGEELGKALDRNLETVREGLKGEEGLLTVLKERLTEALSQGLENHRTTRPGLIANDPPGSWRAGYDPYSRSVLGLVRVEGTGMDKDRWLLSRLV